MTVEKCIQMARGFSRTTTSAVPDVSTTQLPGALDLLNEALRTYGKDSVGLVKEAYLDIEPKFHLSPTMAIRLTITGGTNALAATDIAVTDVQTTGMTGAQVATELQTQIRAAGPTTLTVAWSTTLWKFTIDAVDSTAIAIADPSSDIYASALEQLGFDAESGTTSITGGFPEDCTVEADLPSDFVCLKTNPEWMKRELYPAPISWFESPESTGTPQYYAVDNKKIRLSPVPDKQELFHIRYRYTPIVIDTLRGYQECGLTGKRGVTATGLANSTQYYFKITVDGGTQEELNITTVSTTTFTAIMALINAALTASTYSTAASCALVGGDLRFTSSTTTGVSAISLAAGTTGTNLLAAITGLSLETAVDGQAEDELDVEADFEMAVVYYLAHLMALGNFEFADVAATYNSKYFQEIIKAQRRYVNQNPKISPPPYSNKYANEDKDVTIA